MFSEATTPFLYTPIFEWLLRLLLILCVAVAISLLRRWLPIFVTYFVSLIFKAIARFIPQSTDLDKQLAEAFLAPLRLWISVIGLWIIALVFALPPDLEAVALRLRDVLISYIFYWTIYRLLNVAIAQIKTRQKRTGILSDSVLLFSEQLAEALIIIFGLLNILGQLGFDVAALVAGLGLGGIAVALAAQSIFTDLIGYFVIMTDAPFYVGDLITTEQGSGHVESISFRSTRLRSPDRPLLIIPNGKIVSSFTTNWSRLNHYTSATVRAYNQTLHIDLSTSSEQVLSILADIKSFLTTHEKANRESIIVNLIEIGESSLNILVFCEFSTPAWNEFIEITQHVNLAIMDILKQQNVSLSQAATTVVVSQASAGQPI